MSAKPKVTFAPFITAKRKAPPVEEDEEDETPEPTPALRKLFAKPVTEEAITTQKCVREGCKYERTPSPRKPEYQGLCKYHKDVLRRTRQQIDSKPKRRKAAPEGTPADKLGRLLAVVERLGGLEAAERLAEVLNGLH